MSLHIQLSSLPYYDKSAYEGIRSAMQLPHVYSILSALVAAKKMAQHFKEEGKPLLDKMDVSHAVCRCLYSRRGCL